jgi:hypothetical protein
MEGRVEAPVLTMFNHGKEIMMRRFLLLTAVLCFGLALVLAGCKKEEKAPASDTSKSTVENKAVTVTTEAKTEAEATAAPAAEATKAAAPTTAPAEEPKAK